ncbi:MAG TPA: glycoside hydrolase family 127 protein [Clostridia bacterium]|nr:glycoside hydrolase family 127 protein [Clostridia bacterium]
MEFERLHAPEISDVRMFGPLWGMWQDLMKDVGVHYQLDAVTGSLPDYKTNDSVRNYRIAAGLEEGEHRGSDSDIHKIIEFAAYILQARGRDEKIERRVDEIIDIIEKAQQPDGYIVPFFIIKEPARRWTNTIQGHELYCIGHLIEGAVAYFKATGKDKYLKVARKAADHVCSVFGPVAEGKLPGYPGHPEIEAALYKLYKLTGEEKYFAQAKFFIDERGREPLYYALEWEKSDWDRFTGGKRAKPYRFKESHRLRYNCVSVVQAHVPLREQDTAEGHAVRAVYLYTGMADVAGESGDEKLLEACRRIWNNIVEKRSFIHGGVGQSYDNEAFHNDYFLPNDCYAETCAAIGLMFFCWRMFLIEHDARYMNFFEQILYNNGMSGISLDGRRYIYVNPLEARPEEWEQDSRKQHMEYGRARWLGCACCPPNAAKFLSSVGQYVYAASQTGLYVNLYADCHADLCLKDTKVGISQQTNYPWDGSVDLTINPSSPCEFDILLRIPAWCKEPIIQINGSIAQGVMEKGYLKITRVWNAEDKITCIFPMQVRIIRQNPRSGDNIGRVAVMRGPVLYCVEEEDNGKDLHQLMIKEDINATAQWNTGILGGVVTIDIDGLRINPSDFGSELYSDTAQYKYDPVTIKMVPYYAWNNRSRGEMRVWLNIK